MSILFMFKYLNISTQKTSQELRNTYLFDLFVIHVSGYKRVASFFPLFLGNAACFDMIRQKSDETSCAH